ncbi:aldehyde dehydrogenase (NAD+)/betaine-aldehyde dehydrogenase [Planifilum fimeticola]|uniref:Aldehyde dehydrogenase (NAD+)/betaine-aldehyde dehydrogenase n=1 Tax=Planifilum fimeticola TaxID=201975 RepID=A0A2T0LIW3_9BACL|nr:aldehyde dehydrogenase family protein [Planifilum fimeticola]PRX42383.1 aldehyde dehydrogenase (NAD+)/betaine-aldehyde dehydrogenase [Planifilum fimeticola]
MDRYGLWINGEFTESKRNEWFETRNPADQSVIARVARGRGEDVDAAVKAAKSAFESDGWQNMHPAERGRILLRASELIRRDRDELALLETMDNGKPLNQARTDIEVSARYFEYYAGVADKILGETIPVSPGYIDFTQREPFGVCGLIIPWNYPMQVAARTAAPALAAGNTVVLKPAEETPLTALKLGVLLKEAGLPDGAFNVVPGFGVEAGAALAAHSGIDHLSFTGSVPVGTEVMTSAAKNIVPVTLELGGKSPNIVFADADLEEAVRWVVNSIIQNAGQTCSAGSRLLVERSVHDQLVSMVKDRMESLTVGPGINNPDMGPIISEKQLNTVLRYISLAEEEGAEILTGGSRLEEGELAKGYFVQPTLLDHVPRGCRVATEEIFGPVLSTLVFDEVDEAISIANETPYGLVTGIHTRDLSKALTVAKKVRSGQVFINTYGAGGGVEMPFGGYGKSGFGREKGLEALLHFTQLKNVLIRYGSSLA